MGKNVAYAWDLTFGLAGEDGHIYLLERQGLASSEGEAKDAALRALLTLCVSQGIRCHPRFVKGDFSVAESAVLLGVDPEDLVGDIDLNTVMYEVSGVPGMIEGALFVGLLRAGGPVAVANPSGVKCPTCGARGRQGCVTRTGRPASKTHQTRFEAERKARARRQKKREKEFGRAWMKARQEEKADERAAVEQMRKDWPKYEGTAKAPSFCPQPKRKWRRFHDYVYANIPCYVKHMGKKKRSRKNPRRNYTVISRVPCWCDGSPEGHIEEFPYPMRGLSPRKVVDDLQASVRREPNGREMLAQVKEYVVLDEGGNHVLTVPGPMGMPSAEANPRKKRRKPRYPGRSNTLRDRIDSSKHAAAASQDMFRKTKRQLVRIGKRGGKNAAAAREELKRRGLMPDGSRER